MVASWACEVTEILKQRSAEEASFVCVTMRMTSQVTDHYIQFTIWSHVAQNHP